MKCIVMSDLHGHLPKIEEEFDLLLLPGDVCPVWNHNRHFQWDWLTGEFVQWIKSLPFKNEASKVVMCAGNHDFALEGLSKNKARQFEEKAEGRLTYLDNEETIFFCNEDGNIASYHIFATPYCKQFGNWAFMRSSLERYYEPIPENLDILLSHDAADINDLGLILQGMYRGTNAGNKVLADYVKKRKPKYYFCGHIHSGNHALTDINGTKMANVSIMNEDYEPTHFPLVLDITQENLG